MRHATRWGRAGALAIVAAIGVASAGAVSATTEPGGTGEPEVSSETLVVARTGDIDNLDPQLATAFQTIEGLGLIFDSLTELAPDLTVQPALATDWSYNEDGTELTFHLRDGVTFHDGSEMNSEDVVASIERILDEETGAAGRSFLLSIEDVTAPDDSTVVLTLSTPDATLPAALASVTSAILSSDDIAAGTVGTQPNGTGAFAFSEWTQGQQLDLAANEDYWGDGPYVAGISIRVVPDEQSTLAALQAGEVDLGVITNPAVVEQVSDPLVLERTLTLGYFPFFLNSSRGPLQERSVRQAISCAIDRQELIDTALLGEGEPTGPFVEGIYATDPYDGLPCSDGPDKDLARQLLADGGYPDGFSIETIIITGESETNINLAQNLQSQLAEIGVDLELVQLETNVYVDRWLAADFDSALSENNSSPDPALTYSRYFITGANFANVAGLQTPELDELFAQGLAETDPEARVPIYQEISRILLEESPWVWLYRGYRYQAHVPELEGFVPHPTGSLESLRTATLTSG
jgi:peptide/nickel transport system substrate-binding protein